MSLLEECPARCDRSCESCLSHYHNQYIRDRLDRFVAAQLLRYAISGELPPEAAAQAQATELRSLARLLELDGLRCSTLADIDGQTIPLLVEKGNARAVVGVQSALLSSNWSGHSVQRFIAQRRIKGAVLNDYILRRNLPGEHQLIRSLFN